MRTTILCKLCGKRGEASSLHYYSDRFLLAVRPNTRTLPKGFVCRPCLKKHAKLSDTDFLSLFDSAKPQRT